jgi:hypothetical protein
LVIEKKSILLIQFLIVVDSNDGCDFDLCEACMREYATTPAALTLSELALVEADLHAHLLLVHRNVRDKEIDDKVVTRLLVSFFFLSTRYTWNSGDLSVDEPELFELLHALRRRVIDWLDDAAKNRRESWYVSF